MLKTISWSSSYKFTRLPQVSPFYRGHNCSFCTDFSRWSLNINFCDNIHLYKYYECALFQFFKYVFLVSFHDAKEVIWNGAITIFIFLKYTIIIGLFEIVCRILSFCTFAMAVRDGRYIANEYQIQVVYSINVGCFGYLAWTVGTRLVNELVFVSWGLNFSPVTLIFRYQLGIC